MPRIYKGSEFTLKLLVPQCENAQIEGLKVVLYTDDPTKATEIFSDKITIDGKYVNVKIESYSFDGMNDGVINYIISGDNFHTERQSNYYIKSPKDYTPIISGDLQKKEITITTNNSTSIITNDKGYFGLEEVKVTTDIPMESKYVTFTQNGGYGITPTYPYDGMEYVEVNVDIPLEEEKEIEITQNGSMTITPEDGYEGMKSVVVNTNVSFQEKPLIPNGLFFRNSTWEEFDMGEYDWRMVYNFSNMFNECNNLKRIINFPENIRIYGGVYGMFSGCYKLEEVPYFDTSKVGDFAWMFYKCQSIQHIPPYNTSNAIDMDYMFHNLNNIIELPSFDCHNLDTPYAQKLITDCPNLEEIGGFMGIKCSFKIENCPRARKTAFENVVNGLYNFTYWLETPADNQGELTLIGKLGDDVEEWWHGYSYIIAKGTEKGWKIIFK